MILSPYCGKQNIDIVFELCLENSIKYAEKTRNQKATPIDVIIEKDNQPLPATMETRKNYKCSSLTG